MVNSAARIAVAGCVCLDIIPHWPGAVGLADLAPGKLLEVGPATVSTGGAVSNTGLALHRLGLAVELIGKVGDDAIGRTTLELLRRHGSHLTDSMVVAPGQASSYTVVISPPGSDRLFLHCPGANHTFAADDIDYGRLASGGSVMFHFGYPPLMRRMHDHDGEQLASIFSRVRQLGLTTSLDMANIDPASPAGQVDWPALLANVLPHVDLFVPSLDETLFMLDREMLQRVQSADPSAGLPAVVGIERIRQLAERLLAMGPAVVAFKLGQDGLYLRTTSDASRLAAAGKPFAVEPRAGARGCMTRTDWLDCELLAPCFAVDVAGTTGSGDCTIAGLLAGLLAGQGPEQAITSAVGVGACSVEQADATSGVPCWPDVMKRIESGWPRLPTRVELPKKTLGKPGR